MGISLLWDMNCPSDHFLFSLHMPSTTYPETKLSHSTKNLQPSLEAVLKQHVYYLESTTCEDVRRTAAVIVSFYLPCSTNHFTNIVSDIGNIANVFFEIVNITYSVCGRHILVKVNREGI